MCFLGENLSETIMKRLSLILCMLLSIPIAAYSYDAYIKGIYYNFLRDEATVTYGDTYNSYFAGITM